MDLFPRMFNINILSNLLLTIHIIAISLLKNYGSNANTNYINTLFLNLNQVPFIVIYFRYDVNIPLMDFLSTLKISSSHMYLTQYLITISHIKLFTK